MPEKYIRLSKTEQVAQIAWDWLLAGRHAEDIADLIRKGHAELRWSEADAANVRSEALR